MFLNRRCRWHTRISDAGTFAIKMPKEEHKANSSSTVSLLGQLHLPHNHLLVNAMASFMPSKASLTAATASNALYKPKNRPVGVFLGGTSGIGQAMAEQLAKQTNGRARIVIMGRNQVAADRIIAGFPKTSASTPTEEASDYSFIKVDATSIAQIRNVTSELSKDLDKINFIVTTAGFMTLKGRDETSEGLDRKMACNFYARFRLIQDLIPLVEKAVEMGEQTGVVNVLAPGRGGPITTEDLGLVKTYGSINARYHAIAYNDVAFEASLFKVNSVGCRLNDRITYRNLHSCILPLASIISSLVWSLRP
jgi:NAD(P)-dependent dehydrogenase (short-subunit alcohol dehydrogenase family)